VLIGTEVESPLDSPLHESACHESGLELRCLALMILLMSLTGIAIGNHSYQLGCGDRQKRKIIAFCVRHHFRCSSKPQEKLSYAILYYNTGEPMQISFIMNQMKYFVKIPTD
jgi:hypothetical protein